MKNSDQNDVRNWAAKLSELDSVPGWDMKQSSANVWEKLELELQPQKPGKKTRVWYWYAAAYLILFSLFWWTAEKHRQQSLASTGTIPVKVQPVMPTKQLPGENIAVHTVQNTAAKKNPLSLTVSKAAGQKVVATRPSFYPQPAKLKDSIRDPAGITLTDNAVIPPGTITNKKLQVVYLYQLDQGNGHGPTDALMPLAPVNSNKPKEKINYTLYTFPKLSIQVSSQIKER